MPKKKAATKKWLNWLDQHALQVLSSILLVLVPLFPKIPFFSPIEEYIVRVRIEDFAVLVTVLVWLTQVVRQKIKWNSLVSWFVISYAIAGLLSVISALFVIKTVPFWLPPHVLKTALHYLRYLEYFSLFFIFLASIRQRKDVERFLLIIALSLVGVGLYGIGQKYFYWPVYSTMNREFSKGIRLYLTEHARVQSTFAGHYDMAAYLVIILPIVLSLAFNAKSKLKKWGLFLIHFLGAWLLIMSASRTSFAGYGLGTLVVIGLQSLKKEKWQQKIAWFGSRFAAIWLVMLVLMISFGSDIYERFEQVILSYPTLREPYQQVIASKSEVIGQISDMLRVEGPVGEPPDNSLSTDEAAAVIVASDQRPITEKPSDVYVDVPDKVEVATTSADGTVTRIIVDQPRVWSDNALEYGLSVAIRLDTLWPRAIQGFVRNPYFGSGYATLNKTSLTDFTIADSTDNNFLRTLGETGLIGFITFYGVIVVSLTLAARSTYSTDPLLSALSIGYVAATLGLLLNAYYIDVFAASKVAFTYWSVTGILIGYDQLVRHEKK